jgi:hypothetical protein
MANTGGEHPDGITPGTTKVVAPCLISLCPHPQPSRNEHPTMHHSQ